jgi:hypothetical protein
MLAWSSYCVFAQRAPRIATATATTALETMLTIAIAEAIARYLWVVPIPVFHANRVRPQCAQFPQLALADWRPTGEIRRIEGSSPSEWRFCGRVGAGRRAERLVGRFPRPGPARSLGGFPQRAQMSVADTA